MSWMERLKRVFAMEIETCPDQSRIFDAGDHPQFAAAIRTGLNVGETEAVRKIPGRTRRCSLLYLQVLASSAPLHLPEQHSLSRVHAAPFGDQHSAANPMKVFFMWVLTRRSHN